MKQEQPPLPEGLPFRVGYAAEIFANQLALPIHRADGSSRTAHDVLVAPVMASYEKFNEMKDSWLYDGLTVEESEINGKDTRNWEEKARLLCALNNALYNIANRNGYEQGDDIEGVRDFFDNASYPLVMAPPTGDVEVYMKRPQLSFHDNVVMGTGFVGDSYLYSSLDKSVPEVTYPGLRHHSKDYRYARIKSKVAEANRELTATYLYSDTSWLPNVHDRQSVVEPDSRGKFKTDDVDTALALALCLPREMRGYRDWSNEYYRLESFALHAGRLLVEPLRANEEGYGGSEFRESVVALESIFKLVGFIGYDGVTYGKDFSDFIASFVVRSSNFGKHDSSSPSDFERLAGIAANVQRGGGPKAKKMFKALDKATS